MFSAPPWPGSSICAVSVPALRSPMPFAHLRRKLTLNPAACTVVTSCVVTSPMNKPIDDCGTYSESTSPLRRKSRRRVSVPSTPWREEEDAEDKHSVWARGLCTGLSARGYLRAAGEHLAICWPETMRCLTAITWMNIWEVEQRGGVLSGATP